MVMGKSGRFYRLSQRFYPLNKPSFMCDQQTIAVAGIAIRLMDISFQIEDGYLLTIIARPSNTGVIHIAPSEAQANQALHRFDGLAAGLAISLRIKDPSAVWINGTFATDGVSWIIESG